MRTYITGSKGQLGRALMRRLAHHYLLGVDLPEVDLTDLPTARSSIAAFKPDVIIHARNTNPGRLLVLSESL